MVNFLELSDAMALDIAGYLHRKYRERVKKAADDDQDYSLTQFAADIGIKYKAFDAIYNNRKGATRMDFAILQQLIKHFKKEFTDEFGLTPPDD